MIKPLGERVLIKVNEANEKTNGGIVRRHYDCSQLFPLIPHAEKTSQEKTQEGKILAVGETKEVKTGDVVIYDKYSGTHIKVKGKEYLIIKVDDILAILE